MNVHFPKELEERIGQMALSAGSSAESLVVRAVEEWLQRDSNRTLPARHLVGGIITPQ